MAISLDDGPYRVTVVNDVGTPMTRKVRRWKDALEMYRCFIYDDLSIRYAIIVELSDDPNFAGIREEFTRK